MSTKNTVVEVSMSFRAVPRAVPGAVFMSQQLDAYLRKSIVILYPEFIIFCENCDKHIDECCCTTVAQQALQNNQSTRRDEAIHKPRQFPARSKRSAPYFTFVQWDPDRVSNRGERIHFDTSP